MEDNKLDFRIEYKGDKDKYSITDIIKEVEVYFQFKASTRQSAKFRKHIEQTFKKHNVVYEGKGKRLYYRKDTENLINLWAFEYFVKEARTANRHAETNEILKEYDINLDMLNSVEDIDVATYINEYQQQSYLNKPLYELCRNASLYLEFKKTNTHINFLDETNNVLKQLTDADLKKLAELYHKMEQEAREDQFNKIIQEHKERILYDFIFKNLVSLNEELLIKDLSDNISSDFYEPINDLDDVRRIRRLNDLESYYTNIIDEMIKSSIKTHIKEEMENYMNGKQFKEALKNAVDECYK